MVALACCSVSWALPGLSRGGEGAELSYQAEGSVADEIQGEMWTGRRLGGAGVVGGAGRADGRGLYVHAGGLETALCSNGVAVAELAGDAVLNWGEQLPLDAWEGVSTGGAEDAPARVTELQLDGRGLTGEIPAGLGALHDLKGLDLDGNGLTGAIPAALGALDESA